MAASGNLWNIKKLKKTNHKKKYKKFILNLEKFLESSETHFGPVPSKIRYTVIHTFLHIYLSHIHTFLYKLIIHQIVLSKIILKENYSVSYQKSRKRHSLNRSLTLLAPCPTNTSSNSGPEAWNRNIKENEVTKKKKLIQD